MSTLEASSIPLALVTAAFGLGLPYPKAPPTSAFDGRGGAGLKGIWEPDAEGYYKGKPFVVLGGSSSVGQYGRLHIFIFFLTNSLTIIEFPFHPQLFKVPHI